MSVFLAVIVPIVAFQLSPALMPIIGWLAGTAKDAVLKTLKRNEMTHEEP